MTKRQKIVAVRVGIALLLLASALGLIQNEYVKGAFLLAAYIISGYDILWKAVRNILRGQVFDENFLMAIATVGAIAIGDYAEGVAVMVFYQVGELFNGVAVNKSRKSIAALMAIRPDYATLITAEGEKRVPPDEVEIGSEILINPGEKIPLDGIVVSGCSSIDTAAISGESMPRDVFEGDSVVSGCVNMNGVLKVRTTKVFGESTVCKILDMVENATAKKARAENFITKFARYYTPAVVIGAAVIAFVMPLIMPEIGFLEWVNRALVFLVVSCPCALVISIPLGFFGGIGGASKKGILIKGSNYVEAAAQIKTVVFDKTGTLTKGSFKVTEITPFESDEDELLKFSAYAQCRSSHPIALSLLEAYGKEVDKDKAGEYEQISGLGVRVRFDGDEILCGNKRLMDKNGMSVPEFEGAGTVVYTVVNGRCIGRIVISDTVKDGAKKAIDELHACGVKNTVMLTGDGERAAQSVAKELAIDEVHASLLPTDKVNEFEKILAHKGKKETVAFVGDGVNDAPVLARADVGIAMGAMGSDAAIEACDIVIMNDDLEKLSQTVKISRKTISIVRQNIVIALAVKAAVLILGAFGLSNMWAAVFADVGVAVIAILNSIRTMR